jgi:hypothetical protein
MGAELRTGKGCVDICRCMPCCNRRSDQDSLEDTGSVDVDHHDTVVGKEHLFNAQPTHMERMTITSTAPTQAIPTRQFQKDQVEMRPN